jgi:hypothetical protein
VKHTSDDHIIKTIPSNNMFRSISWPLPRLSPLFIQQLNWSEGNFPHATREFWIIKCVKPTRLYNAVMTEPDLSHAKPRQNHTVERVLHSHEDLPKDTGPPSTSTSMVTAHLKTTRISGFSQYLQLIWQLGVAFRSRGKMYRLTKGTLAYFTTP